MDRTLLPNVTPFPDVLTDQIMPLVSGDEWKVIHYGVRYALGRRSADTLTIAQFAHGHQDQEGNWIDHGTGLDEPAVKECLGFLCDAVHIFLREDKPHKPLGYRLNLDLSSIDWTVLEKRQPGSQAAPSASAAHEIEPAPEIQASPPPAPRLVWSKAPVLFVETPAADLRLDESSDRTTLEKLLERMNGNERQTFDHLLNMAREHRMGHDDEIVWPIYRLWQTYGFRRLQNAFQSPMRTADLGEVNQSCLVGAVTEMLDRERFGPITPAFRDQVILMASEWPKLIDWKNAVDIAVKINKRRLQTVETILKNNSRYRLQKDREKGRMREPQPLRRAVGALRDDNQNITKKSSRPSATPTAVKSGPARPTSKNASQPCSRCGGSGFLRYDVPYGDPNFGKLRQCPECQTVAARQSQALQNMSSLRGKLLTYTFANFHEVPGAKPAYDAALAFAQNHQGWLVIHGKNGNGKTHLAAAIANRLRQRNVAVMFLNVPDLLDYLRNAFAPRQQWDDSRLSFEERFDAIKNAPVLILDDFGAESETQWANEKLYQILNHRTDLGLPTVVTTNLQLVDIEARLRSRLGNQLLGKVVLNGALDYRLGEGT